MKLTEKDKDFLEALRALVDKKNCPSNSNKTASKVGPQAKLWRQDRKAFGMTRQGVRWRFQRLFTEIYSEAYVTIYAIESLFGTDLRHKAMEIAKERVELRKNAQKSGKINVYRRETGISKRGLGDI